MGVAPTMRVEVGDQQVDRGGCTCRPDKHAECHKAPRPVGTPGTEHGRCHAQRGTTATAHVTAKADDRAIDPFGVPENPKWLANGSGR